MDPTIASLLGEIRWFMKAIAIGIGVIAFCFVIMAGIATHMPRMARSRMSFNDRMKLLLDEGRAEKVRDSCEAHLGTYPEDSDAYWYLAHATYRTGDLRRALRCIRKVADYHPEWTGATDQFARIVEQKLVERGEKVELRIVSPNPALNPEPPSGGPVN